MLQSLKQQSLGYLFPTLQNSIDNINIFLKGMQYIRTSLQLNAKRRINAAFATFYSKQDPPPLQQSRDEDKERILALWKSKLPQKETTANVEFAQKIVCMQLSYNYQP